MRGRFSRFFAGAPLIEHYSGSEMLQERFYDCKIVSLSLFPSPCHPRSLLVSRVAHRDGNGKSLKYIYICRVVAPEPR